MGWFMSPDLFIAITLGLVILCFVTLGLLFSFLLLHREVFPRRLPVNGSTSDQPADLSDSSLISDRPLHCPASSSLSVAIAEPP